MYSLIPALFGETVLVYELKQRELYQTQGDTIMLENCRNIKELIGEAKASEGHLSVPELGAGVSWDGCGKFTPNSSLAEDQYLADQFNARVLELELKRTRAFKFPNGGHSIRKLANALEELEACVEMEIGNTSQYGEESYDVYFQELRYTTTRATGPELAKMLRARGTRFRCHSFNQHSRKGLDGRVIYSYTCSMDITTDVLDLMCNPDTYLGGE